MLCSCQQCLRHEVVGNWKFTLGKPSSERSGCGHARPDAEESQPSFSVVDAKEELTIELGQPNIAKLNGQKGTWTMIYDEGLEVKVGNRVYMAFSNFFLNKDLTGSGHNTSHCDQTQVGWTWIAKNLTASMASKFKQLEQKRLLQLPSQRLAKLRTQSLWITRPKKTRLTRSTKNCPCCNWAGKLASTSDGTA